MLAHLWRCWIRLSSTHAIAAIDALNTSPEMQMNTTIKSKSCSRLYCLNVQNAAIRSTRKPTWTNTLISIAHRWFAKFVTPNFPEKTIFGGIFNCNIPKTQNAKKHRPGVKAHVKQCVDNANFACKCDYFSGRTFNIKRHKTKCPIFKKENENVATDNWKDTIKA